MKRVKFICASVLMLVASAVYADPAAVIDGDECRASIPDEIGGLFPGTVFATDSHKVITGKGVVILTCHFDHDKVLEQATAAQGFLCGISLEGEPYALTNDSKMFAAPGGKATMVCKINGDSIFKE